MKDLNFKKIIIILLIIFVILLIAMFFLQKNERTNNSVMSELEYIRSDEITEDVISPTGIHVLLAAYKGDVNPKSISKSTYHLATKVIPKYYKSLNDADVEKINKYFSNNSGLILVETGISNKEHFVDFINTIKKLKGNPVFESSRFDMQSVNKSTVSTSALLYIKYNNNNEISFKVTVDDRLSVNSTSIIYKAIK